MESFFLNFFSTKLFRNKNQIIMETTTIIEKIYDIVMNYGPRLIGALVVLIVGLFLIKIINGTIKKRFDKRDMEPSLNSFLQTMISMLLKILLFIVVAGMFGVQMASFIAIIGALAFAVGMALSGTLQNFAGGVMLLLFEPFKTGDYIEAQGYAGTVNEIQLFNTILKTPDNRTIIIPNGGLSTNSMVNYSTEPRRRVDFVFGIAYGDNVDKARKVLIKLINDDERILKDPEPFIVVSELADSSVNIVVRVWAEAVNYWGIHFDLIENVYKTFDKEGLNIPFPQMDVHVQK